MNYANRSPHCEICGILKNETNTGITKRGNYCKVCKECLALRNGKGQIGANAGNHDYHMVHTPEIDDVMRRAHVFNNPMIYIDWIYKKVRGKR